MSAKITKVTKEHGKRYTSADRIGGFGHKWGEWFENGWFASLEKLGELKDIENGYIGFMRCNFSSIKDTFEYWIGMFLPENTEAPEGFAFIDLPESDVAVCWISGKENDGIYDMHGDCISKFQEEGMGNFRSDYENRACFFERYNCPRFTEQDAEGNIVLDYGIYLAD